MECDLSPDWDEGTNSQLCEPFGYIYVRSHHSFTEHGVCKLGKTHNIPERNSHYITGEFYPGKFSVVYAVPLQLMDKIDVDLKIAFKLHNFYVGGGTEFYDKAIINKLEPFFIKKQIQYKRLTNKEIAELYRVYRERIVNKTRDTCAEAKEEIQKEEIRKEEIKKEVSEDIQREAPKETSSVAATIKVFESRKNQTSFDFNNVIEQSNKNNNRVVLIPRKDQQEIINVTNMHFREEDKGVLVLPCGIGKTLISLWVAQHFNATNIIIGVPNLLLLYQWADVVKNIFPLHKRSIVASTITWSNIKKVMTEYKNKKYVVITTYASSIRVDNVAKAANECFDFMILDEAHHLTTTNMELAQTTRSYVQMLNIPARKQLALTATMKNIENMTLAKPNITPRGIVSNNDKNYFGEIITTRSLLWAIENKIVCDYVIQTVMPEDFEIPNIAQPTLLDSPVENKQLYLAAYAGLLSIARGHSHHLLIYANCLENAEVIIRYIKLLLNNKYFDLPNLYYSSYNSTTADKTDVLHNFETSQHGLITCVYCLGEGWDFPRLDGVVFAENMTSNIRIVQSALRACRRDKTNPDKIAKIILPIFGDWITSNPELRKVREVIYQMSLEDATIIQKIEITKIAITAQTAESIGKLNGQVRAEQTELMQRLKLKTFTRPDITYAKAKSIITEMRATREFNCIEDYAIATENNINLPIDPEKTFKTQWKGWVDYLGIERKYYDLKIAKEKINEYLNAHPEINNYNTKPSEIITRLCANDPLFPPYGFWLEYYNIPNISVIINLTIQTRQYNKILEAYQ